jgi:murein DD-endopeptidase MepM/ murein hydrolase activator NlpD
MVIAACSEGSASEGSGVIITPLSALTSTPAATAATTDGATATPAPAATVSAPVLSGFTYPIGGACLPSSDLLMPNAPREYRNGVHEGVDFYNGDSCTPIVVGMDVVAAKAGTVIRADLDFAEMTPAELQATLAAPNSEAALDRFRGRQVWIDHGGGVVTRYAHLDGIAPGISRGSAVETGQVVGYVGESGTPEALISPGGEYHLHFEVRVGNTFLGAGVPAAEVRAQYLALFAPREP